MKHVSLAGLLAVVLLVSRTHVGTGALLLCLGLAVLVTAACANNDVVNLTVEIDQALLRRVSFIIPKNQTAYTVQAMAYISSTF